MKTYEVRYRPNGPRRLIEAESFKTGDFLLFYKEGRQTAAFREWAEVREVDPNQPYEYPLEAA